VRPLHLSPSFSLSSLYFFLSYIEERGSHRREGQQDDRADQQEAASQQPRERAPMRSSTDRQIVRETQTDTDVDTDR
jgi:hypothetical protein